MIISKLRQISCCLIILLLAACSSEPTPKFKSVKIGKPYEINGKTYYPAVDSTYDKIGDASWYGPGFHGKRTASGEIFDQEDITAAHPTLPIPSLVLVTNLKNDKSIVCRINDRGPFHSNRIIDLSKRTAELVGMKSTQPVRVQFLKKETEDYIASIEGKSPRIDMVAWNENYNNRAAQRVAEPVEQVAQIEQPEAILQTSLDNNQDNYTEQAIDSVDLAPSNSQSQGRNLLISEARADDNIPSPKPLLSQPQQHYLQVPPPRQYASNSNNIARQAPTAASGSYHIIAGSFSMQGNANNLADALTGVKDHKKMVAVDKVERGEKTWWRVNVGPFASRDDAEQALKAVRNAGVLDAHISRQ